MEGNIENITEQEMLATVRQLFATDELQPNELTITKVMELIDNVKRKRIEYVLTAATAQNILKARRVIVNGRLQNAYSPNEGTWKDVAEKLK